MKAVELDWSSPWQQHAAALQAAVSCSASSAAALATDPDPGFDLSLDLVLGADLVYSAAQIAPLLAVLSGLRDHMLRGAEAGGGGGGSGGVSGGGRGGARLLLAHKHR